VDIAETEFNSRRTRISYLQTGCRAQPTFYSVDIGECFAGVKGGSDKAEARDFNESFPSGAERLETLKRQLYKEGKAHSSLTSRARSLSERTIPTERAKLVGAKWSE
jgi:hypothetical protein